MGASGRIRIGVLTSSRADFGIYLPLLKALKADDTFETEIIAFGTHLSRYHGYTIAEIERHGFIVSHRIASMLLHDDAASIASAYALTALKFAEFWNNHYDRFDWVICLGDRYEMAGAVAAGLPLGVKFAHIHGGETTLGAIDNVYRHSISLSSKLHFVSTPVFKERIKHLIGDDSSCVVTGSLSLDNLKDMKYLSREEFLAKWGIDLNEPFILITIHPETVAFSRNRELAEQAVAAMSELVKEFRLVITMPNADTLGSIFRDAFQTLTVRFNSRVHLIENFGVQSYFTSMRYAEFLMGNTSSGIIEAASFEKYVINLGDRQKGRLSGDNVIHTAFDSNEILKAVNGIKGKKYAGENIYKKGYASEIIINALKEPYVSV